MDKTGIKDALRREFITRRKKLSRESRLEADEKIITALTGLLEISGVSLISAYITDGTEPDLRTLIAKCIAVGKEIFLPRAISGADYEMVKINDLNAELIPGKHGIMEPIASLAGVALPSLRDATWLVPLVAYDRFGGRLGRGKGIYDRLLTGAKGAKIGIGYHCQEVSSLPMAAHDCRLDMVVTENGIIRFTTRR